jgi:hypothetical protein
MFLPTCLLFYFCLLASPFSPATASHRLHPAHMPASMTAFIPDLLPASVYTLPLCLAACLPAVQFLLLLFLPACLRAYLPASLPLVCPFLPADCLNLPASLLQHLPDSVCLPSCTCLRASSCLCLSFPASVCLPAYPCMTPSG